MNKIEQFYKEAKKITEKYETEQLNIRVVIASDFLTSRKLPYGNTMRSIFKKNPKFCKVGNYYMCERFLHEGYMLAYRRLKNNLL